MTITIDKDYILASKVPQIRAKAKEFKARLTDSDILNIYKDGTNSYDIGGKILKCEVSAFSSSLFDDSVSYQVDMFIYEWSMMRRITFIIHEENGIYSFSETEGTSRCETFTKDKAE
jgi:hypothetical protein